MNYLFALQSFLRTEELPSGVEFGPAVRRGLRQLRDEATQAHRELFIERKEEPQEIVQEPRPGKKLISYSASMTIGYREGGTVYASPSSASPLPQEPQLQVIAFVVDSTGKVIGLNISAINQSFGESLKFLRPKMSCTQAIILIVSVTLVGCALLYLFERLTK